MLLTPTLTVSGLTVGTTYAVLRYNSAKSLPTQGTYSSSTTWAIRFTFVATSAVATITPSDAIWSNGTYFYRVISAATRHVQLSEVSVLL